MFVCTYRWAHALLLAFVEPGFGRLARLHVITFVYLRATINSDYNGCCFSNLQLLLLLPRVTFAMQTHGNAQPLSLQGFLRLLHEKGSPSLIS